MKMPPNGAGATIETGVLCEGEKKTINHELWQGCAGPLINLPAAGTHVVYFPQGHSEQVAASLKKDVDAQIPNYPNLPSKLLCRLHNVTLHADPETDEVYAQMTLQPVPSFDKDALLRSDLSLKSNKPQTEFFCKTLTASDTSTHGGFSVPRRAAEKIFPPLDFSMQPPAQELVARDLHDTLWTFRHIYRGQPKRHLLTTGWSLFVSGKRLFAGDSVLFIRDEKQQLLLGIRRANRQPTNLSSSVLSSDSMHIGILAAAAHAAANNSPFTVFYNPRASPSEFVIPLAKYYKAVNSYQISLGMRFRMMFETEESGTRRYMGTITGISDLDGARWKNSQWRNLQVGWDESTAGERRNRVSIWEIEPVTAPFFICPPPPPFFRSKRPRQPGLPDDEYSEIENLLKRTMPWMGDDMMIKDSQATLPGLSLAQWMNMQQNPSLPNSMIQANYTNTNFPGSAAVADLSRQLGFSPVPNNTLQYNAQRPPPQQQVQQFDQLAKLNSLGSTVQHQNSSQNQNVQNHNGQLQTQPMQHQQNHHLMMPSSSGSSQPTDQIQLQLLQKKLQLQQQQQLLSMMSQQQQQQQCTTLGERSSSPITAPLNHHHHQQQQQQQLDSFSSSRHGAVNGIPQTTTNTAQMVAHHQTVMPSSQMMMANNTSTNVRLSPQQQQHQQQLQVAEFQGQLGHFHPTATGAVINNNHQQQISTTNGGSSSIMTGGRAAWGGHSVITTDDVPSSSNSPSTNNISNINGCPSTLKSSGAHIQVHQSRIAAGEEMAATQSTSNLLPNHKSDINNMSRCQTQNQGVYFASHVQSTANPYFQTDHLLDTSSSATCQNDVLQQQQQQQSMFFNRDLPCHNDDSIMAPFGNNHIADHGQLNIPQPSMPLNHDNLLAKSTMMGLAKDFSNSTLPVPASYGGGGGEELLIPPNYDDSRCKDPPQQQEVDLSSSMMSQSFGVPDLTFDSTMNDTSFWAPPQFQRIRTYTKVYKRGAVGRSIDISAYMGYDELKEDLARRFGIEGQLEDLLKIGWKLVYVDHENDLLLVGDDPWEEFVSCVRCIKILSPQEVQQLSLDGVFGSSVLPNPACSSSDGANI